MILNSSENNTGILGSGFGLYGYLPAIVLNDDSAAVFLLNKDRYKFEDRSELADFKDNIHWADEDTFYKQINTLVVCLSPEGQFLAVIRALAHANIKNLLLEKPLAVNTSKANELLSSLIKSTKNYRIGYNFQYTTWGKSLLAELNDFTPKVIRIGWNFFANHFAKDLETWKRYNKTGGGVIRFYGIHLIALFAHANSCEILSSVCLFYSDEEIYKWQTTLKVNQIHMVEIDLNSASADNKFTVEILGQSAMSIMNIADNLNDPFDEYLSIPAKQDRRVNVIKPILNSFKEHDQQYWNNVYKQVNYLWEQVENINICTV